MLSKVRSKRPFLDEEYLTPLPMRRFAFAPRHRLNFR